MAGNPSRMVEDTLRSASGGIQVGSEGTRDVSIQAIGDQVEMYLGLR